MQAKACNAGTSYILEYLPYATETNRLTCFVSRYQASFTRQAHPIMQINQDSYQRQSL
ncbi:hypothetical protein [Phocaeicola sp.]|uniref:hypothetical protein n=1 Tax=Phocaeicola sp. TaxID=2773926 RepID=UPI003AB8BE95